MLLENTPEDFGCERKIVKYDDESVEETFPKPTHQGLLKKTCLNFPSIQQLNAAGTSISCHMCSPVFPVLFFFFLCTRLWVILLHFFFDIGEVGLGTF